MNDRNAQGLIEALRVVFAVRPVDGGAQDPALQLSVFMR
jgi:hypothetical protein